MTIPFSFDSIPLPKTVLKKILLLNNPNCYIQEKTDGSNFSIVFNFKDNILIFNGKNSVIFTCNIDDIPSSVNVPVSKDYLHVVNHFIKNHIRSFIDAVRKQNIIFCVIVGEVYGPSVQKRSYYKNVKGYNYLFYSMYVNNGVKHKYVEPNILNKFMNKLNIPTCYYEQLPSLYFVHELYIKSQYIRFINKDEENINSIDISQVVLNLPETNENNILTINNYCEGIVVKIFPRNTNSKFDQDKSFNELYSDIQKEHNKYIFKIVLQCFREIESVIKPKPIKSEKPKVELNEDLKYILDNVSLEQIFSKITNPMSKKQCMNFIINDIKETCKTNNVSFNNSDINKTIQYLDIDNYLKTKT